MNTFHGSLCDYLTDKQKAAVLLSATCKGNDPELPPCPLFHGSLGPMLFSDLENHARELLQSLLVNSHNITWSRHVYLPRDSARYKKVCDTLSNTRYSSRSIKSVSVNIVTLSISVPFIKSHCQAVEEFRGIGDRHAKREDTDLVLLEQLPCIKKMILEQNNISDCNLLHLSKLSSLQHLNLSLCVHITDLGLLQLSSLLSLRHLDVSGCNKISDAGLIIISNLSSLQYLDVSYCVNISNDGIDHIATKLSALQHLHVIYCFKISASGLQRLLNMSFLKHLDASYCRGIGGQRISPFKFGNSVPYPELDDDHGSDLVQSHNHLSSLQHLDVSYCTQVCNTIVEHLSKKLSSLQHLNLSCCAQISNGGLSHLVRFSSLQHLDLRGCNKLTTSAVEELKRKLPHVRIYY